MDSIDKEELLYSDPVLDFKEYEEFILINGHKLNKPFVEKPANAGPKTDAICQVELLQVAALAYTFLGTINAINEKMVGPKKERKNPPKNTNA